MSTQEELEARIAAAKARQAAIADAQSTAAIAAAQAVEAKDQAYSLLDNTLQGNEENTFTAAQTFHAPVTVGVPRVAAVWASTAVTITDANMRKAGTITDNSGHTLELAADSTRTQDGFAQAIGDSELGLTVTHITTAYTLYDSSSPAGQEGSLGNTRKVYLEGFGYSSRQTLSLSGGKDGVVEVGQPMMLNGNVYIGHGPEGVKARCYFGITAAYLAKAGTITDNNPNHPLAIEFPANSARTIDSCIAEINEQGYKLEVKAIKYNATNIYLESTVEGSAPNGIVFTRKGCFSTYSDGSAQTTTQGSNIKGLDEGVASEWELRQNGYPVASRQTNNVYEGVQVFNNAVALNGTITGAGMPALLKSHLREAEAKVGYHLLQKDYSDKSYPGTSLLQENSTGDEVVYARSGTGMPSWGEAPTWAGKPIRNLLITEAASTEGTIFTVKDAYVIFLYNTRVFRNATFKGTVHVLYPKGDAPILHMHLTKAAGATLYYSAPLMTKSSVGSYMPFDFTSVPYKLYISIPNLANAALLFSKALNFELQDGTLSKCKSAVQLFLRADTWTAAQVLPALAALSDWSEDPDLPEEGYPLSLPAAAAFYEAVHQWWDSHGVAHTYTAGEAPVPEEPLPLGWNVTYF